MTKTEKALPPAGLLLATPSPRPTTALGYGLLTYSQRLEAALASCNADKSSLREWAATAIEAPPAK